MSALFPPGPRKLFPGHGWLSRRKGWIPFLTEVARDYGDIVHFTLGGEHVFLLNHPDYIREVLVTSAQKFVKSGMARGRRLFGDGLLTSEGESHRRQRRFLQPSFHRQRIHGFGRVMAEATRAIGDSWVEGQSFDMHREMKRLALIIAARTMFSADLDDEVDMVTDTLNEAAHLLDGANTPFADVLDRLPLGRIRRFDRAKARLHATIDRVVDRRRRSGEDRGDILSMLLAATDSENPSSKMTDREIRDEVLTLLVAGHETSANALTWTWYRVAQDPGVAARLQDEVDAAAGKDLPGVDHLAQLKFTEMVFAEGLRMYPPGWVLDRRAIESCSIGGYEVPAGSIVMISPFVLHRDPRFYDQPELFRPERWTPEEKASRPKYAALPFGAGPRGCIGEAFAWMEGILVIATIAQRWRLELDRSREVTMLPAIVLRPRNGVYMTPRRR